MSDGTFDPAAYGRHIAASYDRTSGTRDAADEIALFSELAGEHGTILEFGIGTGRLALPLVELGHPVSGVEGSPEMVDQLRGKPGGAEIDVTTGDFSTSAPGGTYDLVLLAWNTIYALPSQEAQLACFANAAAHLGPGGLFAVEAWIPDPGAFRNSRALRVVEIAEGSVVIEVAEIHPATQTMTTNKVFLRSGSVEVFPANHRYAWPAELDLMARSAGMSLRHRWADARKLPYGDGSRTHMSVWCKD